MSHYPLSATPHAGTRRQNKHEFAIFHGWYVVAGPFAVTLVGFGNAYTFGAFVESLEHDFQASQV